MKILFGTNGIRGVVNQELTPEFVVKLGLAIGTYFGKKDILIGYDSRTSGTIMSRAITAGIAATGCHILDTGSAPTPAIQYAVKHFNMDGAVIITASHNPPEYNGIKVVANDGVEISREEEIKIENLFFEERFVRQHWNHLGKVRTFPGVIEAYKEGIKAHIDVDSIQKRQFTVIVDPANSVGGLVTPYLLKELGCKVMTLNAQIDGAFSRLPEPTPENLMELTIMAKAFHADLGIAHDGDADRCMFVDEGGKVVWGDKAGAILVNHILNKLGKGTVVTPISSSRLLEEIVTQKNSSLVWTKVGSTIVSKKMQELGAEVGLEDNGGLFYTPHQPVRDGALAASMMLEILAEQNKPISELVNELPNYFLIKKRIECPNEKKLLVLDEILKQTEDLNRLTIDGVKVFFEDGSVLMRPSGTEAVYRVYAESKDDRRAHEIADWGVSLVKNIL